MIAIALIVAAIFAVALARTPAINAKPRPREAVAVAGVVFALLAAASWLACSCTPTTPGPVTVVDASDASIGDAGPCVELCANLEKVGCHPKVGCATACSTGIALKLVDEGQRACAARAPSADAVRACGGGFCR